MKFNTKKTIIKCLMIICVVCLILILEIKPSSKIMMVKNNNLNKNPDLNSFAIIEIPQEIPEKKSEVVNSEEQEIIETSNTPNVQEQPVVEEPIVQNNVSSEVLATYSGDLTGYGPDCAGCSGRLACDSTINVTNGNTTYNDPAFGQVNIVAASKNLPCGSIVEFNSKNGNIKAIVLDRGVSGTTLDLLTPSESYALQNVGRQSITYTVLRNGY